MDDTIWTNDPYLFKDLQLSDRSIFLWKIWLRTPEQLAVPGKDFDYDWDFGCLKKMPAWQQAEKIWLIDTEGRSPDHLPDDHRICLWDSTIHKDSRVHSYWFWLDWCREVESHVMHADRMIAWQEKKPQYKFDLLLGRNKPTRTKVYHAVRSDPELDSATLISYTGHGTPWIAGIEKDTVANIHDFKSPLFYNAGTIHNSMEGHQVSFNGPQTANLCCFLPWQIYDQTWYTMLVETHQNRIFLSEKTAKPLLGQRIFVAVHSFPGALRLLKTLGFRTFDKIIDESYDDIENFDMRLNAALEQCRRLSAMDPTEVYETMSQDLEHNRQLLLSYRGVDNMMDEMRAML
jgi:hypothetical protein